MADDNRKITVYKDSREEIMEEIEIELEELLSSNKKSWIRIYNLMNKVETEKLWDSNFNSYTAWVRHLASKTRVHESLLWKRKRAGRIYSEYEERARAKAQRAREIEIENLRRKAEAINVENTDEYIREHMGDISAAAIDSEIKRMEEIDISPDNFEIIEKIAQGNLEYQDELMEKTLNGELKRKDLNSLWRMIKYEREESGEKARKSNAYEKIDTPDDNKMISVIKANDIVNMINTYGWIRKGFSDSISKMKEIYRKDYRRRFYKSITEFPVYTGTANHSRRVDMLVYENNTSEPFEIMLHGIEIKVNKFDLINDNKMSEYSDFFNYMWLAIPKDLLQYADKVIAENWGIIIIEKNKAYIEKTAVKVDMPTFRDKALNNIILHDI